MPTTYTIGCTVFIISAAYSKANLPLVMGYNKTVVISVIFAVFNQQALSLSDAVSLDPSK